MTSTIPTFRGFYWVSTDAQPEGTPIAFAKVDRLVDGALRVQTPQGEVFLKASDGIRVSTPTEEQIARWEACTSRGMLRGVPAR